MVAPPCYPDFKPLDLEDREQITSVFRAHPPVTSELTFTNLFMWLLRDDGGVVYLNGTQAYRSPTLPQAPAVITYQTLATNQSIANAPPDNTVDTANLSPNLLVAGTNVIAVEIHQHDTGSSDISFDFALTGQPAPAPPPARLNISRLGNEAVLYWSDATYSLEETDVVGASWRPAPMTNSPSVSTITGNRFFRLKK